MVKGDSPQGRLDHHPATEQLVADFAVALRARLAMAEAKHGYNDNWRSPGWLDECREQLQRHVAKGDPLNVAAYAAFLWFHGAPTAVPGREAGEAAGSNDVAPPWRAQRWVSDSSSFHLTGHDGVACDVRADDDGEQGTFLRALAEWLTPSPDDALRPGTTGTPIR